MAMPLKKLDQQIALFLIHAFTCSQNVFGPPAKNNLKSWKHKKIAPGQGHDYTTGSLPNYSYFKEKYKFITIDISKQKDPKGV